MAVLEALLQAPPVPPQPPPSSPPPGGVPEVQGTGAPTDSLVLWRQRLARDSTDGDAWLLVGRRYLGFAAPPAGRGGTRVPADTAARRAALDTAERAFLHVIALEGAAGDKETVEGDSARVFRVAAWAARFRLALAEHGVAAAPDQWGPLPTDLRVPAVLEELGENLLRDCPVNGVLLTAADADTYGVWYMRFARGLRPDLLVLPFAAWSTDPALRARLASDLKLGRAGAGTDEAWLGALERRRPVCVSMAFERPPEARPRLPWGARSVVWVAGAARNNPRVAPRDFVFTALRLGLDAHDPWAEPTLALYTRAARATRALCEPMATFGVATDVASCRRSRPEPRTRGS
ncbi:MAG TPA: hypothetical protein VM736_00470 [Gemmatimonadales bacterium]|nr:hypothetical protein [Gemmatimonadales bacterium]